MIPLFIAGMRGTGKTSAAQALGSSAEVIDADHLQYQAACLVDPDSSREQRYRWEFWTGHRVRQLPAALHQAFLASYGDAPGTACVLAMPGAILVKDWFFSPLVAVLALLRPRTDWSAARYVVLDYPPEEIFARIRRRDRPAERHFTLALVQERSDGYREQHALRSMVPWNFLEAPGALDTFLSDVSSAADATRGARQVEGRTAHCAGTPLSTAR